MVRNSIAYLFCSCVSNSAESDAGDVAQDDSFGKVFVRNIHKLFGRIADVHLVSGRKYMLSKEADKALRWWLWHAAFLEAKI